MTSSLESFCPILSNKKNLENQEKCLECLEVEKEWDIDRLLQDLNSLKEYFEGKKLTNKETCWLRMLLKGQDTDEISNKFYLSKNTVKSDLSRTLYKYVNELTGKKIGHSLTVSKYLKEAGYIRTINLLSTVEINLLSTWDIDRILKYLALKKGKNLTNKETCWLHLLLQGLDTEEISNELYLSQKTVKSDLSKTLYKYVKELTGKKINHPLEVSKHLKEAGYIKTNLSLRFNIRFSGSPVVVTSRTHNGFRIYRHRTRAILTIRPHNGC